MILRLLLDVVRSILIFIFSLLPNIPNLPRSLIDTINNYLDIIFSNLTLLGFFINISTIKVLIPLFVIVYNFEHIYHLTMWIIRKLPMFKLE
jgi:hypothetical protein